MLRRLVLVWEADDEEELDDSLPTLAAKVGGLVLAMGVGGGVAYWMRYHRNAGTVDERTALQGGNSPGTGKKRVTMSLLQKTPRRTPKLAR